ncbi:unnamed protein product [Ectocarpus sp. CCAP 1310/34]|nr:unnamed protein product [Ectocarpus sp. CCAP 1310/34]
MASRVSASVRSRVRGLVLSGSSSSSRELSCTKPTAIEGSNINDSCSSGVFLSSCPAGHSTTAPSLLLLRRRQQQHRGYSSISSSCPARSSWSSSIPPLVAARPSSLLSTTTTPRGQRRHAQQQPAFCTNSSSSSGSGSSTGKLDVHVTHVDAAAAADNKAEDEREMMPEEDRVPVGAGSTAQGSEDKPNVVRFLDVPGSEQTREEKMTIVFTCTVCETRTAKTFAKLSYEKGVVLARCPGCHNIHLIADRLGWFEEAGDGADGWDIEKITNRIGESDCHVVNEDNVMELNLVDIAGKTTRRKDTPPTRGDDRDSSPESPSSEGQK